MATKLSLDKRSLKAIKSKLKKMPLKLRKKAIRATINPEAQKLKNQFKAITPKGKRKHKNKYAKVAGSGFLKRSFSVRNTSSKGAVGRGVMVRGMGFYLFMSPNETGRRSGSKRGARWGGVSGARKYSRLWKSRQYKTLSSLERSLSAELGRL